MIYLMEGPFAAPDQLRESVSSSGELGCLQVRERIAWLLRVNRLFGQDEHWVKASEFAKAFHGGCWPGTANESKISRWETAALRVPHQAIRRYEQLLFLKPGLITAAADNIHGYYCPDPDCPGWYGWSLPRHGVVPVARIEELIDKARSDDVMTGREWDEITREISAVPFFFISPRATWAELAERLLQEQIVAIQATPYREPVAAALGTELFRIAAATHTELAICIMDALRLLGGPEQRPILERFTLNPGLPPPVMASAARNIGHVGGTSEDRYWMRAVTLQCQLSERRDFPASSATLRGLVYGLGMARNDPLLSYIRDRREMPSQAREAASWWLGHPKRIRQSAVL